MQRVQKAKQLYPFLVENLNLQPADLLLKYKSKLGADAHFAAVQLNGLKRAQKKIPTWFANNATLYPPNINLEQSSGELTALYKGQFFKSVKTSADLTGGFGVDSWAIAQQVERHNYIEPNAELLEIVKSNFTAFNIQNSNFNIQTAEEWLAQEQKVDAIYIDPSRRVEGQKKFKLSECTPDVVGLQNDILKLSNKVVLKLSPLADLSAIVNELSQVVEIHVVALKNEVKELLVLQQSGFNGLAKIIGVNILDYNNCARFEFKSIDEKKCKIAYCNVKKYVYEPNASILKAGAFNLVGNRFNLEKLHPNTHLYTSEHLIDNFMGRAFEVIDYKPQKVNIISRNHPLKPTQLAKKYKVKEGALDEYLLAFRDTEKPKVVFSKRLY
ncbi:MAG: THUMP-like domain-containing protein [Bacteroidia bacterium]